MRIRFEEKWLAHGWTGADFGNTQTKSSRNTEFIRRVSLDFDLGVLLGQ